MSIEPITIPMTLSASEVDIAMGFDTEINVHSGGGSTLQAKSNISPTTSSQTITADVGYDGLSSVQINAMPSGSAKTPATSITANPSISVDSSTGEITASVSKTQSVTPTVSAGYVSAGTAGTVTVSGSNTSNLTTQGAQTIHPSSSDQTIASGKYLTGAQTIKGVTTTNLTAANIKKDVVIEIGDSTDSDCVTSVTGTYEGGGGGSANYESGVVTIASDTETLTVPVTQLFNRFSVSRAQFKADWTYSGARSVILGYGSADSYFEMDSNNTGGNITNADRTPSWRNDKITFSATQITAKLLGNGAIANFPAGSKYVWVAWNEE